MESGGPESKQYHNAGGGGCKFIHVKQYHYFMENIYEENVHVCRYMSFLI